MPDLALVLQLHQRADGFGVRHLRIRPVQLVERDLLELQPAQAALAGLAKVLWPPVRVPAPGTWPDLASFGCDHQIVGIRVQRIGDERLADLRAVRIGRVDEVDAELHRAPERRLCLIAVAWFAPDAPASDPHGAEAHPVHGQVSADADRSGGCRVCLPAHRSLPVRAQRSVRRREPSARYAWNVESMADTPRRTLTLAGERYDLAAGPVELLAARHAPRARLVLSGALVDDLARRDRHVDIR